MSFEVIVKVKTATACPSFPPKCVYCCAPADKQVFERIRGVNLRLGYFNSQVAEKYNLPWTGIRAYGGFEVCAYKGGPTEPRRWSIMGRLNAEVPYCKDHFALRQRIVRASDPGRWMLLMIPFAVLAASWAAYGFPPHAEPAWFSPITLIIGLFGLLVGLGFGFLAHKVFDPPAPPEKKDVLKPPFFSVRGVGGLGYRFMIEHKRSLIEFLDDPYIVLRCEFVNKSYAQAFAGINAGEMH